MLSHRFNCLVLLVCLGSPAAMYGQAVESDDTEAVQTSQAPKTLQGGPDLSQVSQLIVSHTNAFRREEGLREVQVIAPLAETARYFADYMARTNKYGHKADGSRPAERAKKHGYDYCLILENIAYQYNSAGFTTEELANGFLRGWKQSPGHRKNMLDPDVYETGVAVARSEKTGYYYAVQMFGRPASQRIEFQITNKSDIVIEYDIGDRTFPLPPHYTRTHQRCRPAKVAFQWPADAGADAKGTSKTVQPSNGDHYTIVRSKAGELTLRRE